MHLNGLASAALYVFDVVAVTILQDVFVIHRDRRFVKLVRARSAGRPTAIRSGEPADRSMATIVASNRFIASIISGSFKARTCSRTSFSLAVRARCSLGFGTDFRTGQNPEKKSNCSNLGTVLVFILALVPSLGVRTQTGTLLDVVFRFQSQLGASLGISFSSSCGTDPGIEPGSVPGISSGLSFSFRMGLEPVLVLVQVPVTYKDSGLRILIPPTFFLPKVTSGSTYNWIGMSDQLS